MARVDNYDALLSESAARQVALQTIEAADAKSAQYLTNIVDAAIRRLIDIPGGEEKLRKMLRRHHDKALVQVERSKHKADRKTGHGPKW